jgi:N-sulfoglucosamine sulfohydrolase
MNRRQFLLCTGSFLTVAGLDACRRIVRTQPNILWITCEDISIHLGCYGDEYAITPHLDKLASQGVRFTRTYASAPVCTPARSSLITGLYASSMGTQHLRGQVPLSPHIRCFTEYLRDAGYYCSNNVKEDYNFPKPAGTWDESSNTAHWRKREQGQPFFSVFNFITTHQSQTRYDRATLDKVNSSLPENLRHDPARAPVPPYYPDTQAVRDNLAAFYTQITLMDRQVQDLLDQLEADGLEQDTIVFFYADNGDGLPRGKRWLYNTGLYVPLIIRFPEKYRFLAPSEPGSRDDRLINFVDFAPTVLRLTGIDPPSYMQGKAFLGHGSQSIQHQVMALSDRVDEVLDFSRTIIEERFQYIRNFFPHRPRMQRSFYSEITPIRQELRRLYGEGKLQGDAAWLMQPTKPLEELYDLQHDPLQMHNLIGDPSYREQAGAMCKKLYRWMLKTRDLSLLHENDMIQRAQGAAPYDAARTQNIPFKDLLAMADLVGRGPAHLPSLLDGLAHPDAGIRYWSATGLAALKQEALPAKSALLTTLNDKASWVRFTAAEALCHIDEAETAVPVLAAGLQDQDMRVALHAAEILAVIGNNAKPAIPAMQAAIQRAEGMQDHGWYMRELLTWLVQELST